MNERQRELKRSYLAAQRRAALTPMIDCLECDEVRMGPAKAPLYERKFRCALLPSTVLYRSSGAESVDYLNAPIECPKRATS